MRNGEEMKTWINYVLAAVLAGIVIKFFLSGRADKDADIPALLKDGALLIDTRTPGEFSSGHIEGAVNIPHNLIAQKIGDHPKDQTIIVYCHSGARSGAAKRALEQAGYTRVVNGGSLSRMRRQLGQ
jgi:rhodanese-related sulfurtransferase